MTFAKTPVDFNGTTGFAYTPLDIPTNYRRIIVLTPTAPPALAPAPAATEESPAESLLAPAAEPVAVTPAPKPFYFYEFFQGQEVTTTVPLKFSKKKHLTPKDTIYILEEPAHRIDYFSVLTDNTAVVEQMVAWLEANTLK